MKILVVDDEKLLVKGIKFNLENEGYTVETAYDGEEALEKAADPDIDLIVLDLMLPKLDGIEVCQRIRGFSNVPIIMLTAKGDDMDVLMGFENGADDYITKPFNIIELKARMKAILRRTQIARKSDHERPSQLTVGDITIDYNHRNVLVRGGTVELTSKEFDLLEFLARNEGQIYSRDNLLSEVWGYEYPGDVRTVDVHIRRIREKIEENPAEPVHVMTEWGVGYYYKA